MSKATRQKDADDTAPKIAIAGNPNCGKTTLFNALTGASQRVGNWPGVTVDRKQGTFRLAGQTMTVIDLPGVYTLRPAPGLEGQSVDESLAREALACEGFDLIVNIVDATNLERNLYLTAQLLETGIPTIVAVNMMDAAEKARLSIDMDVLSARLGVRVVPMVAATGKGLGRLKTAIAKELDNTSQSPAQVTYAPALEHMVGRLTSLVSTDHVIGSARWHALRLIEGDALVEGDAKSRDPATEYLEQHRDEFEHAIGEDSDLVIAEGRYDFAHGIAKAATRVGTTARSTTSDLFDRLMLHRFAGPVVFLAAIYVMFMLTINLGGAFIDFFDIASGAIFVGASRAFFEWAGLPEWLTVVVSNGIGGGIQTVATFIPIIGVLFLILSFLEDSGYMVRAAFLMDRLMRMIGLPGKAFVPLIVGFGCNVPAIMAARTLEHERDRLLTVLMAPFMSCGARLTVYVLFAAAFFPTGGQNLVFALYLLGIAAAIATGFLLRKTLLKGEVTPFIMELPPYRLPRLKNLLLHTWNRLKSFIVDAGQLIVIVVTILTVVNSIGTDGSFGNEDTDKSMLSAIGRTTVPIFSPIGITQDNWPATVGIFTGIFAKEAVVGTLDALYSSIDKPTEQGTDTADPFSFTTEMRTAFASIPQNLASLGDLLLDPLGVSAASGNKAAVSQDQGVANATFGAMVKRFDGKAGAFAYLLFILLYFPCVAAFGAMVREIGPRWAAFAGVWTTWLAWFAAVQFYQIATFAAHPVSSAMWIAGLLAGMAGFVWWLSVKSRDQVAPAPSQLAGE